MPECVVPGVVPDEGDELDPIVTLLVSLGSVTVDVEPLDVRVSVSVEVLVVPGWLLPGVCSVLTRVSREKMWDSNYNAYHVVSIDDTGEEDDPTGLVLEPPVTLDGVMVREELREPVPEELEPLVDSELLPIELGLDQVFEVCVALELVLPISGVVTVIVEVVPILGGPVGVVLAPLLVVLLP